LVDIANEAFPLRTSSARARPLHLYQEKVLQSVLSHILHQMLDINLWFQVKLRQDR